MELIHLYLCLSLAPTLAPRVGAPCRRLPALGTQCASGQQRGRLRPFYHRGWVTGQREGRGPAAPAAVSGGLEFPVDITKRGFLLPVFPLLPRTTKLTESWSAYTTFASSLPTQFLIPYNVASTASLTETGLLNIRNFLITKAQCPAQPSSSGLSWSLQQ